MRQKTIFPAALILLLALAMPVASRAADEPGPPAPVSSGKPAPAATGAAAPAPAAEPVPVPITALGTHTLAEQLTVSLRQAQGLSGRRVAVLPFVDVNDLQTASDFGRAVGEELGSALHFRNFHLADIRGDDQFLLARRVGELFLARTGPNRAVEVQAAQVRALAERYNLGGVVVGTYAVLSPPPPRKGDFMQSLRPAGQVALNARLIDLGSGAVLAAGTEKVPLDDTIWYLLSRRSTAVLQPAQEIKVKR